MDPKRKLVPPVFFLSTVIAMFVLHEFFPILRFGSVPLRIAGAAVMILGFCITIASAKRFSKLGTPVRPFEESTMVVTTGLFRYTRNPMYLGMAVALLGIAFMLSSASAFIPIPACVAIIHYRFVLHEERFMENLFGEEYLAYKNTVRRWI